MRKKILPLLLLCCLLLSGCGGRAVQNRYEQFRGELGEGAALSFQAELRAEYADYTERFTLRYARDGSGERVTVLAPDLIAGISASVSDGGTHLEYDGLILDTGPLDAYGLSPMSALPALVDTLQNGHLDSWWTAGDETALRLIRDDHLTADVWFTPESMTPTHAELMSDGNVTVVVEISDWS